jgi:O-antigen ligase
LNKTTYILIVLILIPMVYYLFFDYFKGICVSCLFLTSLPTELRLITPEIFPDFSIHRLIILFIFAAYLMNRNNLGDNAKPPFFRFMIVLMASNFLSVLLSDSFAFGIKQFISMVGEIFVLYFVVFLSIKNREDSKVLLTYLCFGLGIVAFIGVFEKYTGFTPMHYIPGYTRPTSSSAVLSTYRHRILLGAAMAMAWPMALVAVNIATTRIKLALFSIIILALMTCFFARSRGPWVAMVIASVVTFLLCSKATRKLMCIFVVLALCGILLNPGVWKTLSTRYEKTFDADSFKGRTFLYRLELWRVAYDSIVQTPKTLVFGKGLGSHEINDSIQWSLSYENNVAQIWSWDNHYACILLETGFAGLVVTMALHVFIVCRLYKVWLTTERLYKNIVGGIIAAVVCYFFMMTNVKIFAYQLHYLSWTLIALGFKLVKPQDETT